MRGRFEYIDHNYQIKCVDDSDEIPFDAREIVLARHKIPAPPHTKEDHEFIARTHEDFARIKRMVYGGRK